MPENRRSSNALSVAMFVGAILAAPLTQPLFADDNVKISEAVRDTEGFLVHTVNSAHQTGETTIRVLLPEQLDRKRGHRVLYVLPVEAGTGKCYGDGLVEVERHDLHDRYSVICVAPTFSHLPWYADHPSDPAIQQETYVTNVVVPYIDRTYPTHKSGARFLIGFSKSGWGAWTLLLRYPDLFRGAAAWDAPMTLESPSRYGTAEIFETQDNFDLHRVSLLVRKRAELLQGTPARLALLGYCNFREDHEATHSTLEELKIPHVYKDGPKRQHRWDSGWVVEAAQALLTPPHGSDTILIDGVPARLIIARLGAKGMDGAAPERLKSYRRVFSFLDADGDGQASRQEYVEDGRYATPRVRAAIFRASDRNDDGVVSEAEYIENRLITDEAQEIFGKLNPNDDEHLTRSEFLESSTLADPRLSINVFDALDSSGDGSVGVPEFLRVWGNWARSGMAKK